jgi:hypothetical protein
VFFKEGRKGRESAEEEGGSLGETLAPPLQGSLKQTLQSILVIYKILEKTLVL